MSRRKSIFIGTNVTSAASSLHNAGAKELEQLEQEITLTLQAIDKALSRANRSINDRLIPLIRDYQANSRQVWEGVSFWKSFLDATVESREQNSSLTEPSSPPPVGAMQFTSLETEGEKDEYGNGNENDNETETQTHTALSPVKSVKSVASDHITGVPSSSSRKRQAGPASSAATETPKRKKTYEQFDSSPVEVPQLNSLTPNKLSTNSANANTDTATATARDKENDDTQRFPSTPKYNQRTPGILNKIADDSADISISPPITTTFAIPISQQLNETRITAKSMVKDLLHDIDDSQN